MTPREIRVMAVLGTVALAAACYAAWHRHQRPPVPDALTPTIELEKRVVYLIHDPALDPGPLMCGCELAARPEKGVRR